MSSHIIIEREQIVVDSQPLRLAVPLQLDKFQDNLWKLALLASGALAFRPEHENFLARFGKQLFDSLFQSVAKPSLPGPIFLEIRAEELSCLPWELLYNGRSWLGKREGIIRLIPGGETNGTPIASPLKVLVALASPLLRREVPPQEVDKQPPLINLSQQLELFSHELAGKKLPLDFYVCNHITRKKLGEELSEGYHLLHFIGHGSMDSLSLEDEYGYLDEVDSNWLRESSYRSGLKLALFSSCYTANQFHDKKRGITSIARVLLEGGIPLVVGMQLAVSEVAVKVFTRQLYQQLGAGRSVIEAVASSRRSTANYPGCLPWEWMLPVLFVKTGALKQALDPLVVFQHHHHRAKVYGLPPLLVGVESSDHFIGRRKELVTLAQGLASDSPRRNKVMLIRGLGGIGKTALVAEVVQRQQQQFDHIIWLSARSSLPPLDILAQTQGSSGLALISGDMAFFRQLAREIGLTFTGTEPLAALRDIILTQIACKGTWLFIFDSVETLTGSEAFRTFLLRLPPGCRALLTARCSVLGTNFREIELSPLGVEDARSLMRTYSQQYNFRLSAGMIQQIYSLIGGHPLAIRLVLSQLSVGHQQLASVLKRLRTAEDNTLFEYIFDYSLELAGAEGKILFTVLALFSPSASREGLSYVLAQPHIEKTLARLLSLGLIKECDGGERYELSQLAQAEGRRRLAILPEANNYYQRYAEYLAKLVETNTTMLKTDNLTWLLNQFLQKHNTTASQDYQHFMATTVHQIALQTLEVEKENALAALEWCTKKKELSLWGTLIDGLSLFFSLTFCWTEMRIINETGLQMLTQIGDKSRQALLLNNIGIACMHQGEWQRAYRYYRQAIQLKQKFSDRHGLAQIYNNLGLVYQHLGKWDKAADCYQHNAKVFQELGDLQGLAQSYNNLGMLCQYQGSWKQCQYCYEVSQKLKEVLGDLPGLAQTDNNIGLLYQQQGKWRLAMKHYRRALRVFTQLGNRQQQAQVYNNIGTIFQEKGKWRPAISFYQRSLQIKEDLGDMAGLAQVYGNLGIAHKEKKDWSQALSFFKKSLRLREDSADYHGMAQLYGNLGLLYKEMGAAEQALEFFKKSLAIRKGLKDRYGMALTYGNIAFVKLAQEEHLEALSPLKRAASLFRRIGDEQNLAQVRKLLKGIKFMLEGG